MSQLSPSENGELEELRSEMHLSSLGDRPHSISAKKLKRLIDLEKNKKMGNLADRCQCCGALLPPENSYRCSSCTEFHYCKLEGSEGKCWNHCGCLDKDVEKEHQNA